MAPAPRLFLITPRIADPAAFAPQLAAALAATDVACVLLRAESRDEQAVRTVARVLAPLVQRHDAAALIEGEARLAARLGLDGVHVETAVGALAEAIAASQPDRIVGIGGLASRDEAMTAGEAGVDYVMFGGPDPSADPVAIGERVAWWAEIFNVPCVGYAVRPDRAGEIARAGAEFVALCDGLWDAPEAIADTLRRAAQDVAAALAPEDVG